ncbi:MAG: HAD family phosphatase [Chloroflexota bacterium]
MSYKGIIFDFNGVLYGDTPLQNRAWQQFATRLRSTPLTLEEIAVHIYGRNNRDALEYLCGRALTAQEVEVLGGQKEALYRQICLADQDGFHLSLGATELLDFLVQHDIPRAIATSLEKENIEFFRQHFQLANWFAQEHIVYDDGLRPTKPAPDVYLRAAALLGLTPPDCVVVEDSPPGIQAAKTAGIGCIIALGRSHPDAQMTMESLGEILSKDLFF